VQNSDCPVCRTADIVCGKWTLLVIRDLAEGRSRFCELERSLEGISPRTLSLRLRALEEEGILVRQTYPEVPPRVEYALTEKGRALVPIVESMRGGSFNLTPNQQASIRFYVLIFVLSFFGWAGLARIIRGEVLSLREREFVLAAKAIGVSTQRILFKELLPNLVAPIVISASLALPAYVTAEAGLSFLGVGLIEPVPSWGQTISTATNWFKADPIYLWLPVGGITILVLALALLGDSIRDAFDPKTRR
jgi:DNA-binding HxlR family transcriptional regulator